MSDIQSKFSLEDKVALISGASKGIGFEIANAYAKAGAKVVICSRKQNEIENAAEKISSNGGKALGVEANVSIGEHRKLLIEKAMKWAGKIDILVNNAGTNPAYGPLSEVSEDAWNKVFEVNLDASLFISQAVYHAWMGEHGGVIINMSSAGAFHPLPGINAYNVTKAALVHLTKCLASEWGGNGIRVNALAPGILKTKLSAALWDNSLNKEAIKQYPLGRFGDLEEVTGAALFLASKAASYITGHAIVIDGGQLVQPDPIKLK